MEQLENWEDTLTGVLIVLFGVLGLILNVIWAKRIMRKASEQADGRFNILLMNLIIFHVGIIILAFPFPAYASFKHGWVWGMPWCTYYGSVALFFGFGIMANMIFIFCDMLLDDCYNNYEQHKYRVRLWFVVWTWINAFFWSITPLLGWSRIALEPTKTSCTLDIMHPNAGYASYIISSLFIFYILPLVGISIFIFNAPKYEEIMSDEQRQNRNYRKILILMVLFVIEWTPYCLLYIYPLLDDPANMSIRLFAAAPIMAKSSVVFTPSVFLNFDLYTNSDRKSN